MTIFRKITEKSLYFKKKMLFLQNRNQNMANWYEKYMTIYGKPFNEVPQEVIDETRERLARLQSSEPLASIVVIGYNEETHLQACLWAISEI